MRFNIFLFLAIFIAGLQGCWYVNEEEDPKVEKTSGIQPRPVFISGKTRIPTTSPLNAATVTSATIITFDASSTADGSLLFFSSEPSAADIQNGNLAGCLAGISSLAGHSWNRRTVDLSRGLYQCNPGNPMEPLTATPFPVDVSKFTDMQVYYWVVLGYNENGMLTHSSSLNAIIFDW